MNVFKPFLRWAGGKTWLIKYLDSIIGKAKFSGYHEPFLGGGAIFWELQPQKRIFLSDLNSELINTYIAIKEHPNKLIRMLRQHKNTKEFYYEIRPKKFEDPIERAAQFIYLNQTSYNGLYRVNLKGQYNVPYGFRTKNFIEEEKLLWISDSLQNTAIKYGDFTCNQDEIRKGDLVFLDPPYTVSHNNNGFIKYNQTLFSIEDQYRLSNFIDYIKERKAFYILTNAAHYTILEIFNKNDRILELSRSSLIGGENAKRGKISEYIFTNILSEV